ncbi:uncharacterized protein AB9W97_014220 [Spinachia spinachia]
MDELHICLVALLGVASCSHDWISGSVAVRRGDNITLYCDCKLSSGVYVVWYRNCTHENQPPLVLKVYRLMIEAIRDSKDRQMILPRFYPVRNVSSHSYDLLIMNATDSDEGLYYCGTEQKRVERNDCIDFQTVYRNGNVTTRVSIDRHSSWNKNPVLDKSSLLWVFAPAATILSSVISFILIYHFCQKTPDMNGRTRGGQNDDGCFTHVVFWPVEVKKTQ